MKPVFTLAPGDSPLLVSMPHSGTALPRGMKSTLTPAAKKLPDTDWHVPELYSFLADLDATVVRAEYSRYVVDLNRPPDGAALYQQQRETGICPLTTFADKPIYRAGCEPDPEQVKARVQQYHEPYHHCLAQTLKKLVSRHGYAVLWDAHSIASRVPRFFPGRLPDLNLGTADGSSCVRAVADAVLRVMSCSDYAVVRNGRFKGGYITRCYGAPADGIHALQMEIAQVSYMDESSGLLDPQRADALRPVLKSMLVAALAAARG